MISLRNISMSEYLSIKEFSNKAGVSKQAIYKQLETRLKSYTKTENGRKLISNEALALFNQSQPDSQPDGQPESKPIQPESTQNQPSSQPESQSIEQRESTQSQPESQSNNQILLEMIRTIQEELEKKDKQLEAKDKQIEELHKNLAEALQLVKGQQVLHAREKVERAIETKKEEPIIQEVRKKPEKPKSKRNIFRRFFR